MSEVRSAASHRDPKWPLMGYAPGEYIGRCIKCDGRFWDMQKRAYHCLPCAVDAANERLEQFGREMRDIKAENDLLRSAIRVVSEPPPTPPSLMDAAGPL